MEQSFEREARLEYEHALKKGKKEYAQLTAKGGRGTLLVLDEIAEQNRIMGYVKRPAAEIPLAQVAGTYTSGRAYSFSAGFLPLHPVGSEFAVKWTALCAAHMSEGLRDPIEVYEYMWNYYVVEGNKRVSVLKYFGAPTVRAEITRMIPQLDENDPETEVYYAFLKYDRTGLFKGVRMSSAENYQALSELEKRLSEDEKADEDDCAQAVLQFRTACAAAAVDMPVGDVILEYVKLYGLPRDITLFDLTARVKAMKPQLDLITGPAKEPTLVLDAKEEAPVGLIERLFSPRRAARVLFAYEAGRSEDNWIGLHEKGRLAMQVEMGDRVESGVLDGLTALNAYEKLSEAAAGYDLVLVTSSRLLTPALRFQLENPDPLTLVYSRARPDARLGTYYGRYYEAVFLCGMAAAYQTVSGRVAYVTPHIEKRFTADINAFALGVKTVRPNATVLLSQRLVEPFNTDSCRMGIRDAALEGADVVMSPVYEGLDLPGMPADAFSAVMALDEEGVPCRYIAAPAWDWGRYYIEIAKAYLNHSLDVLAEIDKGEQSMAGLWWGIGSGVLRFRAADAGHPAACNLLSYLRGSIALGRFNPFHGPIRDGDGVLRVPEHADPKPYDILNMEWLGDFVTLIGAND